LKVSTVQEIVQCHETRLRNKELRRVVNAVARANAPGKEERIAAAKAKRERKNAKRARERWHADVLLYHASVGFPYEYRHRANGTKR
jgi:hypothetical protein